MKILSWLFPENVSCLFCGNEIVESANAGICNECLTALPLNNGKVCLKCGTALNSDANYCLHCKDSHFTFDMARSAFIFGGLISKAVKHFKYDNMKFIATALVPFMANTFVINKMKADYIIPVPLYKWRKFSRGFNQSDLLAIELGKILNIPVVADNLVRTRSTKTQTTLTKKQREKNLDKAFTILRPNEFRGKKILLIDDVFTTGSTVEECATVLKKANVNQTQVLTLASTEKKAN